MFMTDSLCPSEVRGWGFEKNKFWSKSRYQATGQTGPRKKATGT